jgi:hypothetical protein
LPAVDGVTKLLLGGNICFLTHVFTLFLGFTWVGL